MENGNNGQNGQHQSNSNSTVPPTLNNQRAKNPQNDGSHNNFRPESFCPRECPTFLRESCFCSPTILVEDDMNENVAGVESNNQLPHNTQGSQPQGQKSQSYQWSQPKGQGSQNYPVTQPEGQGSQPQVQTSQNNQGSQPGVSSQGQTQSHQRITQNYSLYIPPVVDRHGHRQNQSNSSPIRFQAVGYCTPTGMNIAINLQPPSPQNCQPCPEMTTDQARKIICDTARPYHAALQRALAEKNNQRAKCIYTKQQYDDRVFHTEQHCSNRGFSDVEKPKQSSSEEDCESDNEDEFDDDCETDDSESDCSKSNPKKKGKDSSGRSTSKSNNSAAWKSKKDDSRESCLSEDELRNEPKSKRKKKSRTRCSSDEDSKSRNSRGRKKSRSKSKSKARSKSKSKSRSKQRIKCCVKPKPKKRKGKKEKQKRTASGKFCK